MNPLFLFIAGAVAVVLFFVFKSFKKKENLKPNVMADPNEPPLMVTSSFVDSSFVHETDNSFGGHQPESVLEVAPAPEVLFEKLPEAAPVESPMEVQAEAPKPKAKPKAKKTVVKKKSAAKK